MKINEFIVVEGRDDTERVKRAVQCDTIETNGSAINESTLKVIAQAYETRGVIVLTDPDFPGDKIRNTIQKQIPGVKHAYIDKEKAKNKRGKIGVEHAQLSDIKEALMNVSTPFEEGHESISKDVLIDLGLIVGKDARHKREKLGRKLHIGHSNGKQLINKLNAFGYTEEDVRSALSDEEGSESQMDYKDIATPTRTKALLNQYGFNFKKSLGQNFLIDVNIIHNIIDASDIDEQTGIIEVGPGMGSLTEQLAKSAKKVMAFEIDQRLIPVLKDTMGPYDNVTVINEDILKADIAHYITEHLTDCEKIMVVANLPYYITTPILLNLMQQKLPIDGYVVMMQKEVGERLNAQVGTKAYGSLSIVAQYYTETSKVLTVPKSVFLPPPNVDSIVVKLMKRPTPIVDIDDENKFFKMTKAAFSQRRKTINNNYQSLFVNGKVNKEKILEWLEAAGIDPRRRGETLSIKEFANLYNELQNFTELEF